MQRLFAEEAIPLARETGFIQRERALNEADFAQAMVFGWLQNAEEKFAGLVQVLGRREVCIAKSGLSQRFTKKAALFMQRLLELLTQEHLQAEAVAVPLLRRFSAVVVEDSSSADRWTPQ